MLLYNILWANAYPRKFLERYILYLLLYAFVIYSYIDKSTSDLCVSVCLQYDYEYDEHGDRVVLGKGTFGVVYAGRDLSNQVRLAIKEIPERDSRWGNPL